jgi:hypothetical protein
MLDNLTKLPEGTIKDCEQTFANPRQLDETRLPKDRTARRRTERWTAPRRQLDMFSPPDVILRLQA